jgi:hypothetical protein
LIRLKVERTSEGPSQEEQISTKVVNQEESASHFAVARLAGAVALKDMRWYKKWAFVCSFWLFAVDPRATAALAHTKACGVFAFVGNYKKDVLTVDMTEVDARPIGPVKLVTLRDLRELCRRRKCDILFSVALP